MVNAETLKRAPTLPHWQVFKVLHPWVIFCCGTLAVAKTPNPVIALTLERSTLFTHIFSPWPLGPSPSSPSSHSQMPSMPATLSAVASSLLWQLPSPVLPESPPPVCTSERNNCGGAEQRERTQHCLPPPPQMNPNFVQV